MDERRKCERLRLPDSACIYILDEEGKRFGRVCLLGFGGLVLRTETPFVEGRPLKAKLVDQALHICRDIILVASYRSPDGIGFEFRALDTDTAIEIGITLGHYSALLAQARQL